jgi:hypothetical protein
VVAPASAITRPPAPFAIHEVLDLVLGASRARVLVRRLSGDRLEGSWYRSMADTLPAAESCGVTPGRPRKRALRRPLVI